MENILLSDQSIKFLKETKKWTYFLAILGFVGVGIMVLAGLFMGIIFSVIDVFGEIPNKPNFPFGVLGFIYVIMGVIYFFPVYYLYKFSQDLGYGLQTMDEVKLSSAFRFLKKHFKFIGILIIVLIAFYILIIIVMVIAGVAGAFSGGDYLFT